MLGLFQYSAANAAVQAGLGRLLESGAWNRLLAGKDLEDMISILSGTAYRDAVVEAPDDIEAVERRLRCSLADRIRLPMPFLRGAARRLVDRLWRRIEIDNLIIILRAHHRREPVHRVDESLLDLGPASRLDWDELRNAQSVAGVIERVGNASAGLEYRRSLQNAFHEYRRRSAVYLLEISLYITYYRKLCQSLRRLWGRDGQAARRLVGTMIDFRNLLWAYRYRIFFNMAPETILSYTVPEGGCVNVRVIQRVATGAPPLEIVRELWGDTLPGIERIEDIPVRDAVVELEIIFRRYLYREAREMLTGYPLHLGTALAYIVLLEAEVDDLIALMEGRINGWSVNRIRSSLIGDRGRQ